MISGRVLWRLLEIQREDVPLCDMIAPLGGFIEIHVATTVETCEQRDRKGLYAKARAGIIKEFTGISDPYEAPENPEMKIQTEECTPDEAAQRILLKLESLGYIR